MFLRMISTVVLCIYNLLFLIQQEIENFKKLNLIGKEEFDNRAPEPIADTTQEVPPGPPGLQKGKYYIFIFRRSWYSYFSGYI